MLENSIDSFLDETEKLAQYPYEPEAAYSGEPTYPREPSKKDSKAKYIVGGALGGAIGAPILATGIRGAVKGYSTAGGSMGKRLAGAASGFGRSVANMGSMAKHAPATMKAFKQIKEKGVNSLDKNQIESVRYILKQSPLSPIVGKIAPGDNDIRYILKGMGKKGRGAIEKAMKEESLKGMALSAGSGIAGGTAGALGFLGGKKHKEYPEEFEKEARSLVKDFAAGIDPTGGSTFQYGMADAEDPSKAKPGLARAVGTAGGVVGGGLVVPSAISGLISGMKGGLAGGTLGARASRAGSGFIRGAKKPITGVMDAVRSRKALQQVQEKGVKSLSPQQLSTLQRVADESPLGAVAKMLGKGKGDGKAISEKWVKRGLKGMSKKTLGKVDQEIGTQVNTAIGGLGTSAAIGGGSAYLQYGKGQQATQKYMGQPGAVQPAQQQQAQPQAKLPVRPPAQALSRTPAQPVVQR